MLNKFMTVSPSPNRPSAGALRSIVKTMSMSVCLSAHHVSQKQRTPSRFYRVTLC